MIGIYIPRPKRLLILFRVSYNLNMNLKLKYKRKRFDSFLLLCLQEKKKKKIASWILPCPQMLLCPHKNTLSGMTTSFWVLACHIDYAKKIQLWQWSRPNMGKIFRSLDWQHLSQNLHVTESGGLLQGASQLLMHFVISVLFLTHSSHCFLF